MEIDKKHILSVADTIRKQLIALTPQNVLLSWGISNLAATICENLPALRFLVNGRLHKGIVIVALNEGTDYYEIFLQDKDGKKKVAEDLDFTQFSDFIDRTIERGENEAEYNAFIAEERRKLFMGQV